jgi:uncharacterized protein (DUF1800 family)
MPQKPSTINSPQDARRYGREAVQVLAAAKITRAVYSERQLEEVLVDFWFNHFNVFAGKGRTSLFIPEYEREAIRPHVLGKFRDLLGATAKSPAMLFYLDNWLSADPKAAEQLAAQQRQRRAARGQQPQQNAQESQARSQRELRRELLELHTLGVDGGYTQQDVIEVARAFTGWTIGRPSRRREDGSRIGADAPRKPRLRWIWISVTRNSDSFARFTIQARRSCSGSASRPAAAWKTASACSTSSRHIRDRAPYRDQAGAPRS